MKKGQKKEIGQHDRYHIGKYKNSIRKSSNNDINKVTNMEGLLIGLYSEFVEKKY